MLNNNCIIKSVLILSIFFLILFKVNIYSMELNDINHIYNEESFKSYFFNKSGKLIYIYEYYGEATPDKENGYLLIKDNKEKEIELCVYNQIDNTLYEYEIFDNSLTKENLKFRNDKIQEIFKINNKYILLLSDRIIVKYIDNPKEEEIDECNSVVFSENEIIVFDYGKLFGKGPDGGRLTDYYIYNDKFELMRKGEGVYLIGNQNIQLSTNSNLTIEEISHLHLDEKLSIKKEWDFEKVKIYWNNDNYYAELKQEDNKGFNYFLGNKIKDVIEYKDKKIDKNIYLIKENDGHNRIMAEDFVAGIDFGSGKNKIEIMNYDALEDGYIITGKNNGQYYHNTLYNFKIESLKILDGPFTSISTIYMNKNKYYFAIAHKETVNDNTLYDNHFNVVKELGDIHNFAKVVNVFNYKNDSSFYVIKRDGAVSISQLNNKFEITKEKSYDDYQLYINENKNIGNNKLLFGINDDGLRIKYDLLDENLNIVLSEIVDWRIIENNCDFFEFYTQKSFGYMDYDGNILLNYNY